jgi:hypothetical protein
MKPILAAAVALTLAACQSDDAYFAQQKRIAANAAALNFDPEAIMDDACRRKLQHPESLTNDWRLYCERRGFRLT